MTVNPFMPAVEVKGVRKRYSGRIEALKGVDLTIPRGEIFGLLGPNGAGKSTLIKILLGIVRPGSCTGVMLGQPVGDRTVLKRVGYLPENVQFPDYLTGKQVVRYAAGMSGLCSKFCRKREEELLEFVGAGDFAKRKLRTYSKGMRQRIALAQALVNDPELVFLDEPSDGLDPEGRCEMRRMLLDLKDQGKTIVVSSHLLGELEMICDHVAIMKRGELIEQGRLSELQAASARTQIRLATDLAEEVEKQVFKDLTGIYSHGLLSLRNASLEDLQRVIDILREAEVLISSIEQERHSLEEIFVDRVSTRKQYVGGEQ